MPLSFGIKYSAPFIDQSVFVDKNGNMLSMIANKSGVICSEVELIEQPNVADQEIHQGRWYLPYGFSSRFITEFCQKEGKIRYKYSSKRKRAAAG